jgi:uncharacterized membrane protein YagU involved in acid resistance
MKAPARRRSLVQQCAVGAAGGMLGAFAMNLFARAVHNVRRDGREASGVAPGGDRDGRGVQPPQAETTADRDATVKTATIAYRAVTGHEPSRRARRWLGSGVHYAFGATCGAIYAVASDAIPALRAGYGVAYGAAVWACADEAMIPALNLSRGPRTLPASVHAYALAGHFVWAATLESVLRASRPGSARLRMSARAR